MALWAQLASLIELVAGVAAAGVGTGLAVYAARTTRRERQRDLLREALRIALRVTAPVALACAAAGLLFGHLLSGEKLPPAAFVVGAAAGWGSIIPGLVNAYWLGQQRRGWMLALALGTALAILAAAVLAPPWMVLEAVALAHALPAIVFAFAAPPRPQPRPRFRAH